MWLLSYNLAISTPSSPPVHDPSSVNYQAVLNAECMKFQLWFLLFFVPVAVSLHSYTQATIKLCFVEGSEEWDFEILLWEDHRFTITDSYLLGHGCGEQKGGQSCLLDLPTSSKQVAVWSLVLSSYSGSLAACAVASLPQCGYLLFKRIVAPICLSCCMGLDSYSSFVWVTGCVCVMIYLPTYLEGINIVCLSCWDWMQNSKAMQSRPG